MIIQCAVFGLVIAKYESVLSGCLVPVCVFLRPAGMSECLVPVCLFLRPAGMSECLVPVCMFLRPAGMSECLVPVCVFLRPAGMSECFTTRKLECWNVGMTRTEAVCCARLVTVGHASVCMGS